MVSKEVKKTAGSTSGGGRKKRRKIFKKQTDKVYLTGVVTELLPGTQFKVKVETAEGKEPLIVNCQVKTFFKLKHIKIIKGDSVEVEIDPLTDIDTENNKAKGIIIKRM